MSGTSAGAYRGWKTRTHQLPPVNAGRIKNPRRVVGGQRAKMTRVARAEHTRKAREFDTYLTRSELRREYTPAQVDQYRRENQRRYEEMMRATSPKTTYRARKPKRGR